MRAAADKPARSPSCARAPDDLRVFAAHRIDAIARVSQAAPRLRRRKVPRNSPRSALPRSRARGVAVHRRDRLISTPTAMRVAAEARGSRPARCVRMLAPCSVATRAIRLHQFLGGNDARRRHLQRRHARQCAARARGCVRGPPCAGLRRRSRGRSPPASPAPRFRIRRDATTSLPQLLCGTPCAAQNSFVSRLPSTHSRAFTSPADSRCPNG